MRTTPLVLSLSLLCAGPAFGQSGLEPGEWEFNAVTRSPLLPSAQTMVFKRCVTQEDAQSPERWMARQSEKGDCKLTPGERTGDSMRWQMSCPKTNTRGTGIARVTGPGTVESEMQTTSEFQGRRIEMNTRATGRRVGPCKS